jgi:hypothetical protein
MQQQDSAKENLSWETGLFLAGEQASGRLAGGQVGAVGQSWRAILWGASQLRAARQVLL